MQNEFFHVCVNVYIYICYHFYHLFARCGELEELIKRLNNMFKKKIFMVVQY